MLIKWQLNDCATGNTSACMGTYYDAIARGYERLHKEEQLKKIRIILDNLHIEPQFRLLDVGCGPCFCAWPCEAVGVDPSIELLKFAAKNAPDMKVFKAGAEELCNHFQPNEFDVVVSITAIQNFDDLEKGLREIDRAGKDQFCLTFLKASPKAQQIEQLIAGIFNVQKRVEEEKDIMLFAKKRR